MTFFFLHISSQKRKERKQRIPSSIPFLFTWAGPGPVFFAFFALMMVLQLLVVRFMMPETKGVSKEELSEQLSNTETH